MKQFGLPIPVNHIAGHVAGNLVLPSPFQTKHTSLFVRNKVFGVNDSTTEEVCFHSYRDGKRYPLLPRETHVHQYIVKLE